MPEIFLLLLIRPCSTVHVQKFKKSNVKLLWGFYIFIHYIILNQYYVSLNIVVILLVFQSLRISSLTCQCFSEKNTFSHRNYWMTLTNSSHLLIEKGLYVLEYLEWKKNQHCAQNASEWEVMVSAGKWLERSRRQCFHMAGINDNPMLCTPWMFSFQKSIKTTESFQVIFFYCKTENHADSYFQ